MTTYCAVFDHPSARPRRRPARPAGLYGLIGSSLIAAAPFFGLPGAALAQDCAEAQPAPRQLFEDVVETRAVRPPLDATAFRKRTVAVRLDELPKPGNTAHDTVPFNLFPDAKFEGVVEHMKTRGPTSYTVSGRLLNEPESSYVLVRSGDVVVAEISAHRKGLYEVRGTGNGVHVVRQVNDTALEPCGNKLQQGGSRQSVVRHVDPPEVVERDGPTMLDVMVVYTAEARAAAGGTAAMDATALLFVEAANTTYANSQIATQLRLVYSGEVVYNESGSASTDLSRLTYRNDGHLEEVHTLRDQYGADVVSLLVNDFDYCGIGWMHNGPTRAFSVADFGCGSATFVHEIGHNMGCAHDRANANSPGFFPYSYGHRFTGASGSLWRTVMSYTPGQRIQHFSNPAVLYDGVPTGVPATLGNSADNAQTVRLTSPTMAGYRASEDMIDCNGNFQSDDVDVQTGFSEDCNGNFVPDECDVASGGSADVNGNEVPDDCECDASACNDGVDCTLDTCNPSTGACLHSQGGIPFGDLNFNGLVDVDDVSCALAAFQDRANCPSADVYPCGGNNLMDVDDLSTLLEAFNGVFACPSSCP